MQRFLISLIPYIVVAFVVYSIGFCQSHWFALEGDLVQTSFLIKERRYPDATWLPPSRDTLESSILLVGDSHLDQKPKANRFQQYLTSNVSSHSYWAYREDLNPFTLGVALTDSNTTHRIIIFETIERNFFHSAKNFLSADSIAPPVPRELNKPKSGMLEFKYLGNGLRTICSLFGLRSNWLQNDECVIYQCQEDLPLYSGDELLVTKKVRQRRKPVDEILPIMEDLKHSLKARLDPFNVDFLIYIIPDKATLYNTYCDCYDLHPSFLCSNQLNGHVESPLQKMRKSAESGIMEIFKYSDTHLSATGAQIVGQHLDSLLQVRSLSTNTTDEADIRKSRAW